jgi:PEP-CTERM motif
VRITSIKLSILALVIVGALAMVPAASADSIVFNGQVVGSFTLTTSGTCGGTPIASGDTCLTVNMTGGNQLRAGGDVVGLSGNLDVTLGSTETGIDADSSGLLSVATHPCNSHLGGKVGICITAGSGADFSTLTLLVDSTNVDVEGFHIIGPACGTEQTCFAGVGGPTTIPEPGTLGLLGTGLVGIAGLVRRRFSK